MRMPDPSSNEQSSYRWWLVRLTLLLVMVLGCGPCNPAEEDEDEQPPGPADEFAPAVLPFEIKPGVERMRGLYRMHSLANPGHLEDEPGLLIGVAAPPDVAAVAFPPADRDGYDIAYAAAREPWQRVPLNDVPLEDVGAIATAQTRDGEAWFAFRRRAAPHAIELWRWRPGEEPQSVPFDRPSAADLPDHGDSCPDIDLAIADDGMVDMVYRQSEREVRHARLAAGASAWEDVVVTTLGEDVGNDIGCSLRVEHDESGVPNVLAWIRDVSVEGVGEYVDSSDVNGRGFGWFLSPTGWLPHGWRYDQGMTPGIYGVQGTEMVRVGTSRIIVSSIAFSTRAEGEGGDNVMSTRARGWLSPGASDNPNNAIPCTDSWTLDGSPTYGLSLMRTGNGGIVSRHPSEWRIERIDQCKPGIIEPVRNRRAPVREVVSTSTPMRSPTAANGTRPFDLVVCINEEGQLVVCGGGIGDDQQVGDPPVFSITNAWRESMPVEPGLQSFLLDIVQETGEPTTPTISVQYFHLPSSVTPGKEVFPPTRDGDPWQVGFELPVGSSARIFLGSPGHIIQDFRRKEGTGEVFIHTTLGDRFDPRVPRSHPCTETEPLDARGVCVTPRQDPYIGESIDLPLFVDPTQGYEPPQLFDADGQVIPTSVVSDTVFEVERWMELVPEVELEQLSRYEVRYPEGTTNMFGAEYTVDQRIFFVETRQGPLTLVSSEPADGTMDVPLDTVIRVTFSGPVAFYNDGNDFILTEELDMQLRDVPVTFRERPGYVFEITPESLVPGARYTLTLTDQLRAREDGLNRPLVDAPLYVEFYTSE